MARYDEHGTPSQRDKFGGINWGAAFFGWLVAVGIGALLTALLSAAGAAIALSELESADEALGSSEAIGVVGVIALLAIGLVAYFAGGYVAGRMSRFDGGRQGIAVWVWSIPCRRRPRDHRRDRRLRVQPARVDRAPSDPDRRG